MRLLTHFEPLLINPLKHNYSLKFLQNLDYSLFRRKMNQKFNSLLILNLKTDCGLNNSLILAPKVSKDRL